MAESDPGPNTLDDLLVSRPGGVVRTRTAGGLNWQVVPDIAASAVANRKLAQAELKELAQTAEQRKRFEIL